MSSYKTEDSVSTVQHQIEQYLFNCFKESFPNAELNRTVILSNNPTIKICPDIYCEKPRIIGEIHSHLGSLKSAQMDKISSDILKMNLFEKKQGKCEKFIIICSREEEKQLTGSSYVAEAIRQFDIKVIRYDIPPEMYTELKNAMIRQNMLRGYEKDQE